MESFFGEIEGASFEILEEEFNSCLTGHGRVERLWTGARWVEGLFGFQLEDFFYFLISQIIECLDGMKQMVLYQNFETLPISQTEILETFRDV